MSAALDDDDLEAMDRLTRVCPSCGQPAEYPDCAHCGYLFDRPPSPPIVPSPPRASNDITENAPVHIAPVPSDAPPAPTQLRGLGAPSRTWTYRDAAGRVLFHIYRFDTSTGKEIRPLTLWRCGNRLFWQWKAAPAPRPLYGLDRLAERPDAAVVVCEGEKAADAAAILLPDHVAVSSSGGANGTAHSDWSPLAGRVVRLWADADEAGEKYADSVEAQCAKAGVSSVRMLRPDALERLHGGPLLKGWDAADALAEGITPEAVASLFTDPANLIETPAKAAAALRAAQVEGVLSLDRPTIAAIVRDALNKVADDSGAIFEPDVLKELRALRSKSVADFERVRQATKESHRVNMATFDRQTMPETEAETSALFAEVEPWPEPVDGAVLLDDIHAALKRHVIADPPTLRATSLWIVFTWLTDVVGVAPIAHITAPEKRCGKSVLLSAIGKLAYRPMQVSNIAAAALFRSIELWSPTLLIDEVDTFLRDNEDARGILNAGFTRDSAFVVRCVGDDHTPTPFNVWGAKALCGIGKIADTLADRSIPLRLRRKVTGEHVANLRHSSEADWEALRSRIARWTEDHRAVIHAARPATISGLNDRANDCWEPLLAIADVAGGHWSNLARADAKLLHGVEPDAPSIGAELLADIRTAFESKRASRLFSTDLLAALVEDTEGPWAAWNRGRPMSGRQLAARLGDFGIRSGTLRIGSDRTKGYKLEDFADAFGRYLFPDTPLPIGDTVTTAPQCGLQPISIGDITLDVTDEKTPKTASDSHCHRVTDENTLSEKREVWEI